MGRRYYCDYCKCHLPNNITARKTHTTSPNHLNKVKIYYNQLEFRNISTLKVKETIIVDSILEGIEKISKMNPNELPVSLRPLPEYKSCDVDWGWCK